jgi:glutathione peroxidase
MKKILGTIGVFLILASCQNKTQEKTIAMNMDATAAVTTKENIYQFKVKDLYGKEFDF